MSDKTNFAQGLMHMIKGNLGTGIMAMPASFAHAGLIYSLIGLPFLCFVSTYCVHLLAGSSRVLESQFKGTSLTYPELAKYSFEAGPGWMRKSSDLMYRIVNTTLLVTQLGVGSVYLIFVIDNISTILATYEIYINQKIIFLLIFPVALLLSYIKTLSRLAVASACANIIQVVGISLILEYLLRDIDKVDLSERLTFSPFNDVALGFGSAMFAFEGISVVLPVYSRMRDQNQMFNACGLINVSYMILLVLYFLIGIAGFLKYGHDAKDSITLNLPPTPLYDVVRAMFTTSLFLTYPLQMYVPTEIIWNWTKKNFLSSLQQDIYAKGSTSGPSTAVPTPTLYPVTEKSKVGQNSIATLATTQNNNDNIPQTKSQTASSLYNFEKLNRYEYYCRTIIVASTFIFAMSVPKLNLLMDFMGSLSGVALSLIFPALIHLATNWNNLRGRRKITLIIVNCSIIAFAAFAGTIGAVCSLTQIVASFQTIPVPAEYVHEA